MASLFTDRAVHPLLWSVKNAWLLLAVLSIGMISVRASEPTITVDVSQAPEMQEWGEEGTLLMEEWYPRVVNLLVSKGFEPPSAFSFTIEQKEKGVGYTSGTRIVIASGWIQKRPDDFGLLIHEMAHVIQAYPPKKSEDQQKPGWVVEGIADYIRWGIYEGKPLGEYPVPKDAAGYLKGYQAAAGFFLWLEAGSSPGIVRRLNAAMREGSYKEVLFEEATGKALPELWAEYQEWNAAKG